jgi:hypothetical protein
MSERTPFNGVGQQVRMYGCSIVAFGPPARNQTLCIDVQNNVFLNADDDRFLFLERYQFSMVTV